MHSKFMTQPDWEQTEGRVVKVESIFTRSRRQLIVTFSYEVRGYGYESELYTFKTMNVGDTLIVKYDASNPKTTGFTAQYAQTWRIWWVVMATLLAAALLLMLWVRGSRL